MKGSATPVTGIDEVATATGMGNACGICLNDLQRRIDYFIEERDK